MTIKIRTAASGDIACIVEFNQALASETEELKLNAGKLEPGVTRLIDEPVRGVYYLAEIDGKVVGQTMITYEWSDWRNGDFWWIQSVYVHPDFRGSGVFTALYRHIHELALATKNVCGIRLYVDRHNQYAADIYRALGMQDSNYDMLEIDFTK